MKKTILVGLVVVALLTSGMVPAGVYADDDEDEISDPYSWLYPEEKQYVDTLNAAYAVAYTAIASMGAANQVNNVKEAGVQAWGQQLIAGQSKLAGLSSGFQTPPPESMQGLKPAHDAIAAQLNNVLAPCYLTGAEAAVGLVVDLAANMLFGPKPKPKPKPGLLGLLPDPDDPKVKQFQKFLGVSGCVDGQLAALKGQLDVGQYQLNARVLGIAKENKEAEQELLDFLTDCFIATAAYGTPAAEEIDILRQWRDEFLLHNPAGKAFVAIYYEISPPIADFISQHEAVRTAVREGVVDPAVTVVELTRSWWGE